MKRTTHVRTYRKRDGTKVENHKREIVHLKTNETFYYLRGNMGLKSSGEFTKDKSRWMIFTTDDVIRIGDNLPYVADKKGIFVNTQKFSNTY